MLRKKYVPEQIICKLPEAEILLSQGSTVIEESRQIGVREQAYYRWCKEYGGLSVDKAMKLKEIEKENARLKRLFADLSLDNAILTSATDAQNFKEYKLMITERKRE